MVTLKQLNEKLNYGGSGHKAKLRTEILEENIKCFIRDKGPKYLAITNPSEANIQSIKQSISEMARDYVTDEGLTLWPNDETHPNYMESIVWPRDEKVIQDWMTQIFTKKVTQKHKQDKKPISNSKIKKIALPVTPRPVRENKGDRDHPGPSSAASDITRITDNSDPFNSDLDEERRPSDTREPSSHQKGGRLGPCQGTPAKPAPTANSTGGITPTRTSNLHRARPNTMNSSSGTRSTGGEIQPNPAEELLSDDDAFPYDTSDFASPRRAQNGNTKGNKKAQDMPPPPLRRDSLPELELRRDNLPQSPTDEVADNISRFRGPSLVSNYSTVTLGRRSPSARPRAPEAPMINSEDSEACPSIETTDGQEVGEGAGGGDNSITPKPPSRKPHIWYHIVKSRFPEKIRNTWGPDRVKSLTQLKRKLPDDFDQDNVIGLNCTLQGPNTTSVFEIDHNDEHQMKRLQRMVDEAIDRAMEDNRKEPEKIDVDFDVEMEWVKDENQT